MTKRVKGRRGVKKTANKVSNTRSKKLLVLSLGITFLLVVGFAWGFRSFIDSSTHITGLSKVRGQEMVAATGSAVRVRDDVASPAPVVIPANSGRSVRVPVFYYHYIGNNPNPADKVRDSLSISPDKFEEQMKFVAEGGYNTISYDTLYAALKGNGTLPTKPVILTFDDGYIDFYVNAFPILRKFNLHATVFVSTGLMDQGYYLQWSQIKEMDATGLISFQAHTVHHPSLIALPLEQAVGEITTSKQVLEQQLGKPVNFMAYPYGTSNPRLWEEVKKAGFLGSAGTWGGNVESEGNLYNMPRIKVGGSWTVEDFGSRF
jgi:peptidoglycan/xylan/chitin deacetylase (PgdA/CDA1 family)